MQMKISTGLATISQPLFRALILEVYQYNCISIIVPISSYQIAPLPKLKKIASIVLSSQWHQHPQYKLSQHKYPQYKHPQYKHL